MSYNDLIEDVPPLAQDTDSEEEVEREEFQYWNEDLASANFYFLKTGKSKKNPRCPRGCYFGRWKLQVSILSFK